VTGTTLVVLLGVVLLVLAVLAVLAVLVLELEVVEVVVSPIFSGPPLGLEPCPPQRPASPGAAVAIAFPRGRALSGCAVLPAIILTRGHHGA
jgi:hypothetical protein